MATVELKHVYKKYENGFEAVKDFQLNIEDKEFIIFVGPSGCGKSTTLRMIAGLEDISSGDLLIDGKKVNAISSSDRDIAMVFQNYALYPHMTVRENIAYSLKIHHVDKKVIDKKVQEAAKILGLSEVLDRKPGQLSGGQKQRVAMGRAIVRNPKVFLMDEPLSNLDAKLRGQMRVEIARLYHQLNSTFIYVTHDQTEAMTLGTRIVVMRNGVIQQVDTPQNLFHYPANAFVAGFIGTPPMNFFDGIVKTKNNKLYIDIKGFEVEVSDKKAAALVKKDCVGQNVTVGVRPENVKIAKTVGEIRHGIGTIDVYEMLGSDAIVYINQDGEDRRLIANIDSTSDFEVGNLVHIEFDTDKLHIFDAQTGVTITN